MNDQVPSSSTLPPNFHTPRSSAPDQEPRACFVGVTMVDTTWGRTRIEELAHLSEQRDAQALQHEVNIGKLGDMKTQRLVDFDNTATVQLTSVEDNAEAFEALQTSLSSQRAALVQALDQAITDAQARCDEQIAGMLPHAITYDPQQVAFVEQPIVKVWSPKQASELVDVAIDSVEIDGVNTPVFVRCTPDHVFITPNGDVEAGELVGLQAWRKSGQDVESFVVTTVVPVEVSPVAVFDMEVEGVPSYCVAPDGSSKSAVVHNSKYAPTEKLKFESVFAQQGEGEYETRELQDPATGEKFDFEVPVTWSDQAATILATKYARKAGVPIGAEPWKRSLTDDPGEQKSVGTAGETSARQIFHRLAGAWAYWGLKLGYFDQANAERFRVELVSMLAQQVAAPNSPQWFNTGLRWAYGIKGEAQGHYAAKMHTPTSSPDGRKVLSHDYVMPCDDAYTRPQVHACFIQSVEDDLVGENGIMDLMTREARLFKFGSGTGTNYSKIRGKGEPLAAGGTSSGLLSFLGVSDRSAGAIKSGGTTRRAARMIVLDADHPDIEEFIAWKPREEEKIRALRAAGIGDELSFEDEATNTVSGQNGNNSIRVTDKFMQAVADDDVWQLTYRTTGATSKTLLARDLWSQVCTAAHACAAPGIHFHDTFNAWHTCAADGEIVATNPCSEYSFLHDTACNLASLNLAKFIRADGSFDVDLYKHAVRLWTIVLDLSVSMAGYPSKAIAERSMQYRTLGLGYANLGGALMRLGIPYDSDDGREWCSRATSLLGSHAWQTSAELAKLLGAFPAYERNKKHVHNVLTKHMKASMEHGGNGSWLGANPAVHEHGARNAQCTLLAPTGTISFVMDCDSTGIEPVYALTSTKTLAGGGSMELTCPAAEHYLKRISNNGEHAVMLTPVDPVLACANDIHWRGHLGMMAAAQPFLDGSISKTVNLPSTATVGDISDVYTWAWKHGLKAVAVYRDKSKATQVLTSGDAATAYKVEASTGRTSAAQPNASASETWDNTPLAAVSPKLARGEREDPPAHRQGDTVKLKIGGESHYVRLSRYPDGRFCEAFFDVGKTGGVVQGLADALAIAVSIGLQHGVPAEAYASSLRYQRFEPAGFVSGAPLGIRTATSPVDALAQVLSALSEDTTAAPPVPSAPVSEAHSAPASVRTGAICSNCRSNDLVPAGACLTCRSCGATTGCG